MNEKTHARFSPIRLASPHLFLNIILLAGSLNAQTTPVRTTAIELAPPPLTNNVSLVAVGDLMLGSWVIETLEKNGAAYPFALTDTYLKNGDIAIANLEAPFTLDGEAFEKRFNFKVPPRYAYALRAAGLDMVNLANNHILDYGETGLLSTMTTLENAGLEFSGAGRDFNEAHEPALISAQGKRIALFGYSMTFPTEFYARLDTAGTAYPEPEIMAANLRTWRDRVDYVIVSFHWGEEKRETPKDYQIYFAHLAIDNGADLIIGHHPHVLQGFELYKNRLIAYSLGNYAFGSYSPHSVDSIILKVYLNEEGLFFAHCIPIDVDNRVVEFQPQIANGARKARVLSRLAELSRDLNRGNNPLVTDNGIITGAWASFEDEWLLSSVSLAYWGSWFESIKQLSSPPPQTALPALSPAAAAAN